MGIEIINVPKPISEGSGGGVLQAEVAEDIYNSAEEYLGNVNFVTNNPEDFASQLYGGDSADEIRIYKVMSEQASIDTTTVETFSEMQSRIYGGLYGSQGTGDTEDTDTDTDTDTDLDAQTEAIYKETVLNGFEIKALVGFETSDDGFLNIRVPIFQNVTEDLIQDRRVLLLKAEHLGDKDNYPGTIYNKIAYVKG